MSRNGEEPCGSAIRAMQRPGQVRQQWRFLQLEAAVLCRGLLRAAMACFAEAAKARSAGNGFVWSGKAATPCTGQVCAATQCQFMAGQPRRFVVCRCWQRRGEPCMGEAIQAVAWQPSRGGVGRGR